MGVVEELDKLINQLSEESKKNEELYGVINSVSSKIDSISREFYQRKVKEKLFSLITLINTEVLEIEEMQGCYGGFSLEELIKEKGQLSMAITHLYELGKSLDINNIEDIKNLNSTLGEILKTLEFLNDKVDEVEGHIKGLREEVAR